MKKIKRYTSYADIDRDLAILQLEREIQLEKIKLGFQNLKDDAKPVNMVKGYFGITKDDNSSVLSKIAKVALPFVLKLFKKK